VVLRDAVVRVTVLREAAPVVFFAAVVFRAGADVVFLPDVFFAVCANPGASVTPNTAANSTKAANLMRKEKGERNIRSPNIVRLRTAG
jgi:hypothetical protein